MLFRVVRLYQSGVRHPREAIRAAEPVVGLLIVEDWRDGNASNRALRVAKLKHPTQDYHADLLPPLFDPVITRCDRRGIVLVGTEFSARLVGGAAGMLQGWWLQRA